MQERLHSIATIERKSLNPECKDFIMPCRSHARKIFIDYVLQDFRFIDYYANYCIFNTFPDTAFIIVLPQFEMASTSENTDQPKPKLPLLEIEEKIFLDVVLTSNGADVIAKKILAVIKDKLEVCDNLKSLYREGLFGRNPKVKRRLRNRIYSIKRLNK